MTVEGVVAKHVDHPYRPGVHGWQKLRARLPAEAVVGGVIGSVGAPQVLILDRPDRNGVLQVAGRSKDLTLATSVTVGAELRPDDGAGHPWPEVLPRSRWGGRPAEPLADTRVQPDALVELVVDPAVDGLRGGDGTLSEAAHQLAHRDVGLGVLPLPLRRAGWRAPARVS